MTVIQFSEVAKWAKTDREAGKRIKEKEAIYRGIIEKEAQFRGETLEETLPKIQRSDNKIDAHHLDSFQEIASLKGISVYEVQLDIRIERRGLLVNDVLPNLPPNVEFRFSQG
ncbi:MAG: hypothetical protein KC643_23405 [Nitrospira sp.]|nr:hypothetical protein [Planctomycetaceae bacterium]MCA9468368.1 hypothetical protein [Nitrospira sp.]